MLSKIYHKAKRFLKKILKKLMRVEAQVSTGTPVDGRKERFPIISTEQKESLKDAIKISFIGDMILLRDMVQTAWDEKKQTYDFSHMFEHVKERLHDADLAIGVFEGPMAGEVLSYSTSTFDDGIPIRLNFPDSFTDAVKDAGIDVVTLANNHINDCGKQGLLRTLDVLDKKGLQHVGGYRNEQEKEKSFYIEVAGLKIGVVACTYCPNDVTDAFFTDTATKDLTYGLVAPNSPQIMQRRAEVIESIRRVKAGNPDLVIAMPHMGTQFSSEPDDMQRYWVKVFAEEEVDVILGCHAHHIQPIEWVERTNGKKTLVVYCPGNFVNSYIDYEGDLSMLVNVYLSRDRKETFAVGCTPLYAMADEQKRFSAVPFDALKTMKLSYNEQKHLSELHKLFSNVVLRKHVTIDQLQEEYMLFEKEGYVRQTVEPISFKGNEPLVKRIKEANSICFLGDSITEGTLNGGYGWYEPLMAAFPEKKVDRIAFGGATGKGILERLQSEELPKADIYVIAVGCNDIRYRDEKICAMSASEYAADMQAISEQIKSSNPHARLVYLSPWESADFDPYCYVLISEKESLYREYDSALKEWCKARGYDYINPNPYIREVTNNYKQNDMLKDHIHPNADKGIRLYAEAVLKGGAI